MAREQALNRAHNALTLSRFFLVGHQIDPSYFHEALDTYIRILPFLTNSQEDGLLRRDMLELIQICMSIHSGHPEKYNDAIELLEALPEADRMSEQLIERIKADEAWLPLNIQREKFTKFSQQQQALEG